MPLVSVRLLDDLLDDATQRALIGELTDAIVRVLGEELRAHTWVTLDGVPRERWGFGGRTAPGRRA